MADVVEAMKTEKKSETSLRIDGCVVILSMEITPKKIKIPLVMQLKPSRQLIIRNQRQILKQKA